MDRLTICLFLFCILGFSTSGQIQGQSRVPNKVDRIETEKDVEKFLESIDGKRFEIFSVDPVLTFKDAQCMSEATAANAKSWEKADIDANGYTDLLVNGRSYEPELVVIMSGASDTFSIRSPGRRLFQPCEFATLSDGAAGQLLNYYSPQRSRKPVTLIYKFTDFFEMSESSHHTIERIVYETSGCFGTCPIFELDIKADRTATFDARNFNKKKGKFKATISQSKFDELIGALNYIDFPNLSERYSVSWTDDQTCALTVTYDGGKTKRISDYGLQGTFGLSSLYRLLFGLRENQVWKK